MTHPLSAVFTLLQAGLTLLMIWPVSLIVVNAIQSGSIQGAGGFVVRRSERPGRFWFLVLGLIFLKGLAVIASAFVIWIAVRNWF